MTDIKYEDFVDSVKEVSRMLDESVYNSYGFFLANLIVLGLHKCNSEYVELYVNEYGTVTISGDKFNLEIGKTKYSFFNELYTPFFKEGINDKLNIIHYMIADTLVDLDYTIFVDSYSILRNLFDRYLNICTKFSFDIDVTIPMSEISAAKSEDDITKLCNSLTFVIKCLLVLGLIDMEYERHYTKPILESCHNDVIFLI